MIALSVLILGVVAAFIFLHDDSDLDAIEKKQEESIEEATSEDKFDQLGDDLENFESSKDSI